MLSNNVLNSLSKFTHLYQIATFNLFSFHSKCELETKNLLRFQNVLMKHPQVKIFRNSRGNFDEINHDSYW